MSLRGVARGRTTPEHLPGLHVHQTDAHAHVGRVLQSFLDRGMGFVGVVSDDDVLLHPGLDIANALGGLLAAIDGLGLFQGPVGTQFVAASPAPAFLGPTLSWQLGTLAPGQQIKVTLSVLVQGFGVIDNTASLGGLGNATVQNNPATLFQVPTYTATQTPTVSPTFPPTPNFSFSPSATFSTSPSPADT